MSQHGRRRAAATEPVVEDEAVRRFGFLTTETALVLGLVVLIVLGSFMVHTAFPANRATETVIGDKKVRITTVGKGGVVPGPVQPRTIPVVQATPVPVATPKPRKTPKPVATAGPATPTPTPTKGTGGGPIITPPGGGGGECTVLIFCKPGETPKATPEPDPAGTQPPVPQSPVPQSPAP